MIKVHALGESVIDVDSLRVTPSAERGFALLLYLALNRGRRIPRSILHEMVFPSYDEEQAAHCLRQLLYHQRTAGAPIKADRGGVAMPPEMVWFDFDELLESTEPPGYLLDAADGGIFPGYLPSHSESYAEWFEGTREQMTVQLSRRLADAALRARAIGDRPGCERIARVALRLDPFNRDATLALAQMLALGGARAEASRILERYAAEVGGPVPKLQVAADPANLFGERVRTERRQGSTFAFSGRVDEMLKLNDALNEARANECQRVLIFGEPGIGKTRLVREFCTAATLSGAAASVVALQPSDQHRPFGAVADLLPRLLGIPGALACPPESLSLLRRRLSAGGAMNEGVGVDGPETDLTERLVAAITDLVDAVSSDRVLVLAFEDFQWLDEGSSRSIAAIARAGTQRRLLVLFTGRQQKPLEWLAADTASVVLIGLRPLPSEAVAELFGSVETEPDVKLDAELRSWFEETAQGNPLFLESLLTHYVRTRERFAVPPTLLALLDRRIDLLSADATTMLQISALLGKHSSLETIARSTALPQFALLQAISDLEGRALVRIDGSWVYPSHALIADRALARMGPIQTQMSHRLVASALETLAEQTPSLLWACAEHWTLARDKIRAKESLDSCVQYAMSIGRPRDAAKILRGALADDLFAADRVGIAHEMIRAADLAGEPELALEGIALVASTRQSSVHDDVEFAGIRAEARMFRGAPTERARLFECATATTATPNHRVTAVVWILKHADMNGDADLAKRAINSIDGEVVRLASPELRTEFDLVSACVLGQWDKAVSAARETLRALESLPPSARIVPRVNASFSLWRAGASEDAFRAAQAAHSDAELSGSYRLGVTVAAGLADLSFELDDPRAARDWIGTALASVDRFPELKTHFTLWVIRVVGAIYLGEVNNAVTLFDEAKSLGLFEGSALRARWHNALLARLSFLRGTFALPEAELDRAKAAINDAHPMSGVLDFEVATACDYLIHTGRRREARELLDELTKSPRRNRAALSRELRRVNARLIEMSA